MSKNCENVAFFYVLKQFFGKKLKNNIFSKNVISKMLFLPYLVRLAKKFSKKYRK